MRFRYLLLIFVVVFAATLAVIVGEQLSSESLAVMVGVVAGVGASLPTSLLVLWFALRTAELRAVAEAPARMVYPLEAPEPRIVVVTQRAPAYEAEPPEGRSVERPYPPSAAGYGQYASEAEAEPVAWPQLPAPAARHFTVFGASGAAGGGGGASGEPGYQEMVWHR